MSAKKRKSKCPPQYTWYMSAKTQKQMSNTRYVRKNNAKTNVRHEIYPQKHKKKCPSNYFRRHYVQINVAVHFSRIWKTTVCYQSNNKSSKSGHWPYIVLMLNRPLWRCSTIHSRYISDCQDCRQTLHGFITNLIVISSTQKSGIQIRHFISLFL